MKDCDVVRPELSAYLDGELAPHRRELVGAHLASCPQCQEALAELKTLATGVAALPKLQPSPRFLAEVRRKIARGDHPEALTWRDALFRPFWIKVPLEIAALVAVAVFMMRLEEQQPLETVASGRFAQAENSGNDQSPSPEMEAKSEQPAATESAPAPSPAPPAAAPENEVVTAPAGGSMPSQELQATAESGDGSTANVASEAPSGSYQLPSSQTKSAVVASGGGIKSAVPSKRRVAAVNRGTGSLGITPTPSAAEVATLARSVGIEPSRVSGVVVVQSRDLKNVQGRAEQLADRCNGKVISVPPSMGSTDQIFFVEVPREFAASFKLDMEQNTASSTLSTNLLVAGVAVVTTNASLLTATSTARVVGVLTGGFEGKRPLETNAVFDSAAQLTLANNPATTVLEILVVPPPSLAQTNATPVRATPAH
ncbi:MAG: anti-sigma factor family protein [Verrucomicrobiia bacterium]